MRLFPNGFGYIPGQHGDAYITKDFGESWKTLNPGIDDLYSNLFLDVDTGFVSSLNHFYKTVNGGQSWTKISEKRAEMIQFSSSQDGIALINIASDFDSKVFINCYAFLTTSDGGISWVEGPPSIYFKLNTVDFISSRPGYTFSWRKPYSASILSR